LKIGIPNIIPFFGYIFFAAASVQSTIMFLNKVGGATVGAAIFLMAFLLMCFAMFGLISYRLKIVVMTWKGLIIAMPFRFQYRRFEFDNIKDLKWDLWVTHKMGDYRKLTIQTHSGYRTNISDLEFINYDSLEQWLVDRTNLKLNLDRKLHVELQQAKANRWPNILVIALLIFFLVLLLGTPVNPDVRAAIAIVIVLIIGRLVSRLIQYQQRINENR